MTGQTGPPTPPPKNQTARDSYIPYANTNNIIATTTITTTITIGITIMRNQQESAESTVFKNWRRKNIFSSPTQQRVGDCDNYYLSLSLYLYLYSSLYLCLYQYLFLYLYLYQYLSLYLYLFLYLSLYLCPEGHCDPLAVMAPTPDPSYYDNYTSYQCTTLHLLPRTQTPSTPPN